MTFDEIKDRVIHDTDGKPCGYRRGAKGIIGLVCLVEKFLHLPVEGVRVGDDPETADNWLAFKPGKVMSLTSDQLAGIWAYWKQCKEMTLGHGRDDSIFLSATLMGKVDGETSSRVLFFADQGRAEMLRAACWNVFGLHARLRQANAIDGNATHGSWCVEVTGYEDGDRMMTIYDQYRLEGIASLLARHTIAPAQNGLVATKGIMPVPNSPVPPHLPLKAADKPTESPGAFVDSAKRDAKPGRFSRGKDNSIRSRRRTA